MYAFDVESCKCHAKQLHDNISDSFTCMCNEDWSGDAVKWLKLHDLSYCHYDLYLIDKNLAFYSSLTRKTVIRNNMPVLIFPSQTQLNDTANNHL